MKVLIIEDENPAARRLQKLLGECNQSISVLHVCDSISESVKWLSANPAPELIFMDIQLADGLSFEIFKLVDIDCPVIFTTAFDEYALKAFKVNSIDYLLKPLNKPDLEIALQKHNNLKGIAKPNFDDLIKSLLQNNTNYKERFLVNKGSKFIPVSIAEIAYFYSEDKVTFLKTINNERYILQFTIEELENSLNPMLFFRANRQILVKIDAILSVENSFNSKLKLKITPNFADEIIISREKAVAFKEWLGNK